MTARSAWLVVLAEVAIVFAIALAARLPLAGQELSNDELYHVLAARQYLVDGTFTLHRGLPYDRAEGFTRLIVACFAAFGESPATSRIPALLAGALTAALAFGWLRAAGARGAAWAAGMLVAFDPELVRLSQMCRFYTMQHLLFLLGLVGVDGAFAPRRPVARLAFAGLAILGFQQADALQEATRVGLVGVGAFVALFAAGAVVSRRLPVRRIAALAGGTVAACAVVAFWAVESGFAARQLEAARYVDLWAQGAAHSPRYYHYWLVEQHPTLWPLVPVAALAAAVARPRLALLCTCVFGVGLALHSAMAMKSPRYIAYLLPPFFVLSGLALQIWLPAIARLAERLVRAAPIRVAPTLVRAAGVVAAAGATLFVLATNGAVAETGRLVLADPSYRDSISATRGPTLSWTRAAERLVPELDAAGVVVSTDAMKTLYHLGRLDYEMSLSHLREDIPPDQPARPEFSVGAKLGVPIVTTPASVDRILACHRSGLFVAQTGFFVADWVIPQETRQRILERTEAIELPEAWGVTARRWRRAGPAPDCPPGTP